MGQLPVLRPHVVGLRSLHPPPAGRIAKDGLRGVRVHMDLENITRHRDDERATEGMQQRPHLIGCGKLFAANKDLGAETEVTVGRYIHQRSRNGYYLR